MDITLCFGFLCDLYKKPPTIRVFLDGYLLDEFNLKNSNLTDDEKKMLAKAFSQDIFQKLQKNYLYTFQNENFEYYKKSLLNNKIDFKFYNCKIPSIKDGTSLSLTIDIINNDSNYSNGFITKSTLVSVPLCMVFNTKILEDVDSFVNQWFNKYKFTRQNMKNLTLYNLAKSYKTRLNYFENLAGITIPFYSIFLKKHIRSSWLGGSGKISFYLRKKFNFLSEEKILPGYIKIGHWELAIALGHKYNQYANQRNNH